MKRITSIVLILLLTAFVLFSCSKKNSDKNFIELEFSITDAQLETIGLTRAELSDIYLEEQFVSVGEYNIFLNDNERVVVLRISNGRATLTETYPTKTPTAQDFKQIKEGMSLLDIVETLGMPDLCNASGIIAIFYGDYSIQLDSAFEVMSCTKI